MRRPLSLRARLVLGVLVLAGIGLAAADVVTYSRLQSFLVQRLDRNIAASAPVLARSVAARGGRPDEGELEQLAASTPNSYVGLRYPTGYVDWTSTGTPGHRPPPKPRQPKVSTNGQHVFELQAVQGSTRYRVRMEPLHFPAPPDYALLVAAPLSDVTATLNRLLLIELLVTGGVLVAIAVLGLWLVRLGLRPLEGMARTADAIAAGDLSQRVDRAEEQTEVGRLGLALNAMLSRIEESDQRLRRFVADASHELRTPLAAVRAYAELFERGAHRRPEDLERALHGISRESRRMSSLVEDLLLLARLDEGRRLEEEPVRLDELAGEAVETARAVDPERPIDLAAEPVAVLGDRVRLRQVLDNLLGNIRSHTPPETPAHVRVASSNGHALIEVSDEGPGLSPDDAARVFERFYRADPSRSRHSGGVGLGLAIVAAVAEAHAGKVSVESRPGGGATFRIELPLLKEAARDAPAGAMEPVRTGSA